MRDDWDGIFFYKLTTEGQKQFAYRNWKRVPRINDIVVFASEDKPYKVEKVLWRETKSTHMQYVEIEISEIVGGR